MIKRSDIVRRVYDETECIRFEVLFETQNKKYSVFFVKIQDVMWLCDLRTFRTNYSIEYYIPKKDITLELIAAIGLLRLREEMLKELEQQNALAYLFNIAIEGM